MPMTMPYPDLRSVSPAAAAAARLRQPPGPSLLPVLPHTEPALTLPAADPAAASGPSAAATAADCVPVRRCSLLSSFWRRAAAASARLMALAELRKLQQQQTHDVSHCEHCSLLLPICWEVTLCVPNGPVASKIYTPQSLLMLPILHGCAVRRLQHLSLAAPNSMCSRLSRCN